MPAEATPRGKRTPSCRTKDRSGKLPSSRNRHTVSSPRRAERKALSPVSRASCFSIRRAKFVMSKRLRATSPRTYISGPRYHSPDWWSWSTIPSSWSAERIRWTVERVSVVRWETSVVLKPWLPWVLSTRRMWVARWRTCAPGRGLSMFTLWTRCPFISTYREMLSPEAPNRSPPLSALASVCFSRRDGGVSPEGET